MPKVETWLKSEEISDIELYATEKELSRSAYIRAAVLFAIESDDFNEWLKNNMYLFK
jgi:hypothetical protein